MMWAWFHAPPGRSRRAKTTLGGPGWHRRVSGSSPYQWSSSVAEQAGHLCAVRRGSSPRAATDLRASAPSSWSSSRSRFVRDAEALDVILLGQSRSSVEDPARKRSVVAPETVQSLEGRVEGARLGSTNLRRVAPIVEASRAHCVDRHGCQPTSATVEIARSSTASDGSSRSIGRYDSGERATRRRASGAASRDLRRPARRPR